MFGIISPQTDLTAATAYIIIYVLIIGILLVTYALMRRFTPRLLAPSPAAEYSRSLFSQATFTLLICLLRSGVVVGVEIIA